MIQDRQNKLSFKTIGLSLVLFFSLNIAIGQEICDNGIDDDNDGLIDLLDDECECTGFTEHVKSLIPNESFEDYTSLPDDQQQLDRATGWEQATRSTTDYIHVDGFTFSSIIDLPIPLPDGKACTGLLIDAFDTNLNYAVQDYLGTNLIENLQSGVEYTLNFKVGFGRVKGTALKDFTSVDLALYAKESTTIFPVPTYQCPLIPINPSQTPQWELIASTTVTNSGFGWYDATMVFTPNKDFESIMIGGTCSNSVDVQGRYLFIDNLKCSKSSDFEMGLPISQGTVCQGNLKLTAPEMNIPLDYQWYKDGIAIVGEDSKEILLGDAVGKEGLYSVRASYYDECLVSEEILVESSIDNFEIIGDTILCYLEKSTLTTNLSFDKYIWNTGEDTKSIEVDQAGRYSVTVTSGNCEYIDEIEVISIPEVEISGTVTDTEYGKNEGSINVSILGGDGGFSYKWSDGPVTRNRSNLYGGIYTLTAQDDNLCSDTHTFEVDEFPSILKVKSEKEDVKCYGQESGSITLEIEGGIPPYNYSWYGLSSTDSILTNLKAGVYIYEVNDQSGQIVKDTVVISQNDEIKVHKQIQNITCFSYSDGIIDLDLSGGVAPFTYAWSDPSFGNVQRVENLSPGNYEVTISDSETCTKIINIELNEPEELSVDLNVNQLKCYGVDDAEIILEDISGGTAPYKLYLNGKARNTFQVADLGAGNYTLEIRDLNGCSYIDDILISELDPVEILLTANKNSLVIGEELKLNFETNYQSTENSIVVFGSDFKGDISECIDCTTFYDIPTQSTDYYIKIDNGSCTYYESIFIETIPMKVYIPSAFSPNGDRLNDTFLFYSNDEQITVVNFAIFNRYGQRVYKESNKSLDNLIGWNGRGAELESDLDVYSYKITLKNKLGRIYSYAGSIQIIK